MGALFTVVAVTLGVSAFCSLLEATLYSTRVPALEAAKAEGKNAAQAERFLQLKRDVASPTAAILILNTIANTAGATVAGMVAARELGDNMVPAFSAAFTLAILFVAEILPKTFGATSWKSLWSLLALPLSGLVRVLRPAVWVTRKFSALFTGETDLPSVTEDEIRASIRMGAREGELSSAEIEMLEAVFRFDDTTAREVMVPRDEVVFIEESMPTAQLRELLTNRPFTRYPVCRGSLDDTIGLLHSKDVAGTAVDEAFQLASVVRSIPHIPETLTINRVMRELQSARRGLALVIDEHGTTVGVVSRSDVLEQIVGTLPDEHDAGRGPAVAREAPDSFIVRGNLPVHRINRELGLDLYDPNIVTLSGLLVSRTGRLPKVGDTVELEGAIAEVLDMRGNRATRIRLRLERAPRGHTVKEEAPQE